MKSSGSNAKYLMRRPSQQRLTGCGKNGAIGVSREIRQIDAAADELKREAKRHEHRALLARQIARDFLEENEKSRARKKIETMIAERQYILACGVTARRMKRILKIIHERAQKGQSLTWEVAKGISSLGKATESKILENIEKTLSEIESLIDPEMGKVPSIVSMVEKVKKKDISRIEKDIIFELDFLSKLTKTYDMSRRNKTEEIPKN